MSEYNECTTEYKEGIIDIKEDMLSYSSSTFRYIDKEEDVHFIIINKAYIDAKQIKDAKRKTWLLAKVL